MRISNKSVERPTHKYEYMKTTKIKEKLIETKLENKVGRTSGVRVGVGGGSKRQVVIVVGRFFNELKLIVMTLSTFRCLYKVVMGGPGGRV